MQDRIMKQIDEEIAQIEQEYNDDMTRIEEDEGDSNDNDDCTNKQMRQQLDEELNNFKKFISHHHKKAQEYRDI